MFSGAFCIGLVGVFAVREAVYAPPLLTLRGSLKYHYLIWLTGI